MSFLVLKKSSITDTFCQVFVKKKNVSFILEWFIFFNSVDPIFTNFNLWRWKRLLGNDGNSNLGVVDTNGDVIIRKPRDRKY